MCGIAGYIGEKDAAPIILGGLSDMEYRGYDSAGIAIFNEEDGLQIRRKAGKIVNLVEEVKLRPVSGTIGLGHTRWATHGNVTDHNSHPQTDCNQEIVVIHNGIVENFIQLKEGLIELGHIFVSQTDTEAIAHLIEEELKTKPLFEAARSAIQKLKGHNAIVLISRVDREKIIAARTGNAGGIILGYGEKEMFIASDQRALLKHTQRLNYLENREIAIVDRSGAAIYRLDGERITRNPEIVPYDVIASGKGEFKHYMLKEIHEQGVALVDTINGRLDREKGLVYLDELNLTPEYIQSISRICIVACGTSYLSGLTGAKMIERLAKIPVDVKQGSEFQYEESLLDQNTLVVSITQSGETADVLAPMKQTLEMGLKTITICNVQISSAVRMADGALLMQSGPEIGVASTKSFTGQLACLFLLGLYLGNQRGVLSQEKLSRQIENLIRLPEIIEKTVEEVTPECQKLANEFFRKKDFLFLGRGLNFPIAMEGALKLKEISYIHAEGYAAGEMKHGPIALIDEDMPVLAIATQDNVYEKMLSQIEQVRARNGIIIGLGNKGDETLRGIANHVLEVEKVDELLQPIINVIPLQLLAYYIALRIGNDVDQPRNLAKSVTVA